MPAQRASRAQIRPAPSPPDCKATLASSTGLGSESTGQGCVLPAAASHPSATSTATPLPACRRLPVLVLRPGPTATTVAELICGRGAGRQGQARVGRRAATPAAPSSICPAVLPPPMPAHIHTYSTPPTLDAVAAAAPPPSPSHAHMDTIRCTDDPTHLGHRRLGQQHAAHRLGGGRQLLHQDAVLLRVRVRERWGLRVSGESSEAGERARAAAIPTLEC